MKRLYTDRSRLKSGLQGDSAKGFTLIESALVVIVIGMIAVIAIPKIISLDKHVVSITARQITADMRYARNLAVSNMANYVVTFSTDGLSYTKYEIFRVGDATPVKSRDIPAEVECTAAGDFGVANELTFTHLGSTVTNNGEIISISEPESVPKVISVISATGRVFF